MDGSMLRGTQRSMRKRLRRLRVASARSTWLLSTTKCGAAVEAMTMSHVARYGSMPSNFTACPWKRSASSTARSYERLATKICSRPNADKMLGGQLADLARAEEENLQAVQVAEDLLRQLDGRIRDRDGVLADAGVGADSFRHAHRLIENLREERIERAALAAGQERGAHLSGDLRLADDHRVEPRGDAEEVLEHVAVAKDVDVFLQLRAVGAGALRQPVDDRLDDVFAGGGDDRFDAIAGRENGGAGDAVQRAKLIERLRASATARC